jgi:tetratricopeptide (TPR) repeat protein
VRFAERLRAHARRRIRAVPAALLIAAAAAALFWPPGGEDRTAAALRQRFLEAGRAYDEGRFPDAVRLYEDLIRGGHVSMEVFYNLGSAHAGDGRLGRAVLSYRKAWRLAPRDPDINANLLLALQAAGAPEADLSGAEIVFTRVSEREWAGVAAAAWWTTCLFLSLSLLRPGRAPALRVAAAAAAALTFAALLGLRTWRGFERQPELVVLDDTRNALQAPLASASPRFPLPEGSVVRAREYQGEWVRVSSGQLTGWIRRADCAPVLLEDAPR